MFQLFVTLVIMFIFIVLFISVVLDVGKLNYPRGAAPEHSHCLQKKRKPQPILAGTIFQHSQKTAGQFMYLQIELSIMQNRVTC